MRLRLHLVALALGLAASVVACKGGELAGAGKRTKGDSETASNKPESQETGRPSDDGEGVPGYLRDPENIAVEYKDGKLVFSGPAGTVVNPGGQAVDVPVEVLQIERSALEGEAPASVTGVLKGSLQVAEDGSLAGEVEASFDQPVVIRAGGTGESIQVAAVQEGRVFAAYYDPKSDEAPKPFTPELWTGAATQSPTTGTETETATATGTQTTETELRLKHCWPSPDFDKLKDLIDEKDLEQDDPKERMEELKDDGYHVERCYGDTQKPDRILISMVNDDTPPKTEILEMPREPFKNDLE